MDANFSEFVEAVRECRRLQKQLDTSFWFPRQDAERIVDRLLAERFPETDQTTLTSQVREKHGQPNS